MGLGNRQVVAWVLVASGLALALSGCSASPVAPDASAVAIGQQALTFASSDSSSSSSNNSGIATSCPDSLKQGLLAGLTANEGLVILNPSITAGVMSDPTLTDSYTPSCAFAISVSGTTVDELYFVGISDGDEQKIAFRLPQDGFVPGAISTITYGTQQVFTRGTSRVVLAQLKVEGATVVLVAG